MSKLSSLNELKILSALVGKEKYGLEILNKVNSIGDKPLLLGSLYNSLASLERKGFVVSWLDEEDGESGGNRRRYFKITGVGQKEAFQQRHQLENIWDSADDVDLGGLHA